jgi:hypothetical protein
MYVLKIRELRYQSILKKFEEQDIYALDLYINLWVRLREHAYLCVVK